MKSCEWFCGEGFWLGTRRLGRSIPAAGCDGRANAGPRQKTRRPKGFRAKDRLASLLLGHRLLRVCSLVAPCHPAFSPKTDPLAVFNQTLNPCRPDLVGFVNGLPLVVIELKKPGVPARAAFDENLTHYKAEIPQLFWFNALLIASNGTDSRVGSLTADWERFFEVRAGLAFNASSARTSRAGCRWR